MNQDNLEVETKLYVPDLQTIAIKLEDSGATLTKPRVFERNVRYENVDNTLTQQDIVVRLRQDTRARLTYKEPRTMNTGEGISARFEAEVEVGDFDTMELILGRLGYHSYLVYEKWRTTYTFGDAEILLDELPFGNFVEIEGPETTIHRIVSSLGLQDAPRFVLSYTALFDHIKQVLKLDFRDLTFENFRTVDVPSHVFLNLA
jgi:adenylate cyclase class 2